MTGKLAPLALPADPMREAMARAAAKARMSLDQWIEHTNRLERAEKQRRATDRLMRQVPRYREEVAA